MKHNLSIADKTMRMFIALVITVLSFSGIISGIPAIVGLLMAVFLILTTFNEHCPVYHFFGFSTRKRPHTNRAFRSMH